MILKPLKIEDCPQFYTATILDWKKLLKPEKYKLIIIESLQFLVILLRQESFFQNLYKINQLYSIQKNNFNLKSLGKRVIVFYRF